MRTVLHYLMIVVVGLIMLIVNTVITPYWGLVAVFFIITIICFRWEHYTREYK